jgi:hypothetical protein
VSGPDGVLEEGLEGMLLLGKAADVGDILERREGMEDQEGTQPGLVPKWLAEVF